MRKQTIWSVITVIAVMVFTVGLISYLLLGQFINEDVNRHLDDDSSLIIHGISDVLNLHLSGAIDHHEIVEIMEHVSSSKGVSEAVIYHLENEHGHYHQAISQEDEEGIKNFLSMYVDEWIDSDIAAKHYVRYKTLYSQEKDDKVIMVLMVSLDVSLIIDEFANMQGLFQVVYGVGSIVFMLILVVVLRRRLSEPLSSLTTSIDTLVSDNGRLQNIDEGKHIFSQMTKTLNREIDKTNELLDAKEVQVKNLKEDFKNYRDNIEFIRQSIANYLLELTVDDHQLVLKREMEKAVQALQDNTGASNNEWKKQIINIRNELELVAKRIEEKHHLSIVYEVDQRVPLVMIINRVQVEQVIAMAFDALCNRLSTNEIICSLDVKDANLHIGFSSYAQLESNDLKDSLAGLVKYCNVNHLDIVVGDDLLEACDVFLPFKEYRQEAVTIDDWYNIWSFSDTSLSELLDEFLLTLDGQTKSILVNIEHRKTEVLKRELHRLKGTSGNYQVQQLYLLVKEMEDEVKQDLVEWNRLEVYAKQLSKFTRDIMQVLYQKNSYVISEKTKAFNVLIAEDVEANRQLIERILGKLPVHVTCVTNGLEAIEYMNKENVDLLLLDLQMPIVSGEEVLRAISRGETNKPKWTAIVSAHVDMIKTQNEYVDQVFVKPIDTKAMLAYVRRLIEGGDKGD